MMMIWLPAEGVGGITAMARVSVLNAQPGATVAARRYRCPSRSMSLPLTGSTYHLLPLAASHVEQV